MILKHCIKLVVNTTDTLVSAKALKYQFSKHRYANWFREERWSDHPPPSFRSDVRSAANKA